MKSAVALTAFFFGMWRVPDQWIRLRDMPTPIHGINGSVYKNDLIRVVGGGTGIGGFDGSHHNQVFKPTVSCE